MCLQMDFQLLSGSIGNIWGEFEKVRYRPILSKKPGPGPMVIKMADFGKCRESFQSPLNASYVLANGFPTISRQICDELGWIPKDPKSADFEHKAWAIARHGFENDGFEVVRGIVKNSLKRLLYAWKWISTYFQARSLRFWVNSEGSEIGRFWAKSLGYSPWFW